MAQRRFTPAEGCDDVSLFQPGKLEVPYTVLNTVASNGEKQGVFPDKFKSFWLSSHLPNDPLTSVKLWNQHFQGQLNSPALPEGNQEFSRLFSRN